MTKKITENKKRRLVMSKWLADNNDILNFRAIERRAGLCRNVLHNMVYDGRGTGKLTLDKIESVICKFGYVPPKIEIV